MVDLVVTLVALAVAPVLLIWWIPAQIHELGHFLGAMITGARFAYVPLGPFIAYRAGRVRVRLAVRRWPCDAVLPGTARPRVQLFVATLAGPLAGVVGGVLVAVIGFSAIPPVLGPLTQLLLIVGGMYIALTGLMNALPWRPQAAPTDGRRVMSLIVNSAAAKRWVSLRVLSRLTQGGVRPRDWPAAMLTSLVTASDGSLDDVAGALTLYQHLVDEGRLADARAVLQQARAAASQRGVAQVNSQLVLLELAYIEARTGDDPSVAAEAFLRSAFIERATLARVGAAIQLRYSFVTEATALAERGLHDLEGQDSGWAVMERDLLAQIAEDARRGSVAGVSMTDLALGQPRVDVSRFATPDVTNSPPQPRPGLLSSRTLVGLVSSLMLAALLYAFTSAFFGRSFGVWAAGIGSAVTLTLLIQIRRARWLKAVAPTRQAIAALAVICGALPVLLSDLFRPNAAGYIWLNGMTRPCASYGTGHDLSSAILAPWGIAIALIGLAIATRSHAEPARVRVGIMLGVGGVVLWIVTVSADHAPLALLLRC